MYSDMCIPLSIGAVYIELGAIHNLHSFSLFCVPLLTNLLFITDKGKPTSVKALGLVYVRKLQRNKLVSEFLCI